MTNKKLGKSGIVNIRKYILNMKQQQIHISLILKLLIILALTYYYITYVVVEE